MARRDETNDWQDTVETEELTGVTTETQEYGQENLPVEVPAEARAASSVEPPKTSGPSSKQKMLIAAFVLGIVGTALALIALVVGGLALASGGRSGTHLREPGNFQNGPGVYRQFEQRDQRNEREQRGPGRVRSEIELEVDDITTQS